MRRRSDDQRGERLEEVDGHAQRLRPLLRALRAAVSESAYAVPADIG